MPWAAIMACRARRQPTVFSASSWKCAARIWHGAAAIAVLYPPQRIGLIAALQPLYLALTQMQQTGGFAYAQPNACCIFNHLHSLELFLTSSPSLEGDRISLQLWGDIILEHL